MLDSDIAQLYQVETKRVNEAVKNNPDKFYILFSKPTINMYMDSKYENGKWDYTYSDMATVYENVQIFEMPIEVYEKVY